VCGLWVAVEMLMLMIMFLDTCWSQAVKLPCGKSGKHSEHVTLGAVTTLAGIIPLIWTDE
jgi:hypothetical protein